MYEIIKTKTKLATTFAELVEIALRDLEQLHTEHPHSPVVMVCGPMTTGGLGTLSSNMAAHGAVVRQLVKMDIVVWNQAPYQNHMMNIRILNPVSGEVYDYELLTAFYQPIFESGLIQAAIFRHDWRSSIGTRWEFKEFGKLGVPRFHLPFDWDKIAALKQ